MKVNLICGVKTNIVTSVEITGPYANDSPQFKPLVKATARIFSIREVGADKAYLSKSNLELVMKAGGVSYIPFKSNTTGEGQSCGNSCGTSTSTTVRRSLTTITSGQMLNVR